MSRMRNPSEENTEKFARGYRKNVLVYRITGTTYKAFLSILRRPSPLPRGGVSHWFAALMSLILSAIITALIQSVAGTAALQETFLAVIALGVVFFLTLRQAEMVGRRVIDTLLIKMKPSVHSQKVWDSISKDIKGQGLVATAIALVCIPAEVIILCQLFVHTSAIWPLVVFLSVEIWVLTSSAYMGIFSSRNFVHSLGDVQDDEEGDDEVVDLNLYKFDPARTPILQPIMGLFAGVMFDQAILGVVVVLSFFVVRPTSVTASLGTALLVLIILMLIGNFLYAQLKIGALISQAKRKTFEKLQEEISHIDANIHKIIEKTSPSDDQTKTGSGDQQKELSMLLNLYEKELSMLDNRYEKVERTRNFAFDIESFTTYLSGLIWSLVTLLTVNLPVPQHLLDNISQLLSEFSQLFVQLMSSGL